MFLFIASSFLGLIDAQTPGDVIFDPVKDLFYADFAEGDISPPIAKYLFWILLSVFVWSIIDLSGLISNEIAKWIVSIIIGFLGVAYLTPADVWVLLASYQALGLTLLFILPTIILVFFTFRVAYAGGAGGVIAQHIIWIIYFIFLVWKFITGILNGQIQPNNSITWLFVGILAFVGLAAILNKFLIRLFGKEVLEAQSQAAGSVLKKAARMSKMRAEELEELAS